MLGYITRLRRNAQMKKAPEPNSVRGHSLLLLHLCNGVSIIPNTVTVTHLFSFR